MEAPGVNGKHVEGPEVPGPPPIGKATMNTAVTEENVDPVETTGTDNVVEIRGGEVLPELDDQPLPADAEVEVVVPEQVSIRVQVRDARLASRGLHRGEPGWWSADRWAAVFVIMGFGLIGIAGVLVLVG